MPVNQLNTEQAENATALFYRNTPLREINPHQTMYSLVKNLNKNNLDKPAIGFLGRSITYRQLFRNVDKLADSFHKLGVCEGDTVALLTISMPVVQENLLALSKIGAVSEWIDLRIKGNELIKKLNERNCQILIAFDGMVEELSKIISETSVKKGNGYFFFTK